MNIYYLTIYNLRFTIYDLSPNPILYIANRNEINCKS